MADQVVASRYRYELLRRLRTLRDGALREELYRQLEHFSRLLDAPVPPWIAFAARATADAEALLQPFWAALILLEERGEAFNHATREDVLGLQLPQLRRLFKKNGIELQIDKALQNALKVSEQPRFLASSKAMHSALTGSTVKCWVFAVVEG